MTKYHNPLKSGASIINSRTNEKVYKYHNPIKSGASIIKG